MAQGSVISRADRTRRGTAVKDGPGLLYGPFHVRDLQIRCAAEGDQAGEGLTQATDCLCRLR